MIKLKKSFHHNQGFTLIELLIVISIIGILAAVMLLVINPTRVQNRARNAAIKSTLNKIGFALNGSRSALGKLPDETQLNDELENVTLGTDCVDSGKLECTFAINGPALPSSAAGYKVASIGSTAGASLDEGKFRIVVNAYDISPDTGRCYVLDYSAGLFNCACSTLQPSSSAAVIKSTSLPSANCTVEK